MTVPLTADFLYTTFFIRFRHWKSVQTFNTELYKVEERIASYTSPSRAALGGDDLCFPLYVEENASTPNNEIFPKNKRFCFNLRLYQMF